MKLIKRFAKKIKTLGSKLVYNLRKKKQELSSIHSISQLYQSSLINLPRYILDCENNGVIDIDQTNELISSSNTVTGLTNIIIQISLRRGDRFNDANNNLLNIFADLGRNFTTVLSKDRKDLYIAGSILDYIDFFKYTRDYGNPYIKAILKEINENTYKQPFTELIRDEFMNERKFLTSYEYDSEIHPTACANIQSGISILEENDFIDLYNHFFEGKIDAYEVGKLCCITLKFSEEFIDNNPVIYNWLLRIAKAYYFSSTFTVMRFTYTDLLQFLNSNKFKSISSGIGDSYKSGLFVVKKQILCEKLFFDKDIFTPRYKLEQLNPENPDEILTEDETVDAKSTQEHSKIPQKDVDKNMEDYIKNIDNPNGSMTNINLDNFYEDDETYDPEDYV